MHNSHQRGNDAPEREARLHQRGNDAQLAPEREARLHTSTRERGNDAPEREAGLHHQHQRERLPCTMGNIACAA